ncbi:MAG TPA: hypothetical protein VHE35_02045 [Kofleriaceae bacterium]|nr:hypothetical protein [Kofleriaceae bacterium]
MSTHAHGGRARGHHKDRQVCRQVADAVGWFLVDVDDPLLSGLLVIDAVPAPSAARVLVTLAPGSGEVDAALVLRRLAGVKDEVREEVAAEVHRRRAPELVFRVEARLPAVAPPDPAR